MTQQQEKKRKKHRLRKNSEPFHLDFPVYEVKDEYDALTDKHASTYFKSQNVRKHLRHIKINNFTGQKDQNTYSIGKIWEQKSNKLSVVIDKIKPYKNDLKPFSKKKLRQTQNYLHLLHKRRQSEPIIQKSSVKRQKPRLKILKFHTPLKEDGNGNIINKINQNIKVRTIF